MAGSGSGFRAGGVGSGFFPGLAYQTDAPVSCGVSVPFLAEYMLCFPFCAAFVTIGITAVVVDMTLFIHRKGLG